MNICLKNANLYHDGQFLRTTVSVVDGLLSFSEELSSHFDRVIDCSGFVILPGFVDVHVHLREPGFSYKETIKTGTLAAARGGYSLVCTMPNLNPTPDCLEALKVQTDIIERDACITIKPYGTITCGEKGEKLSDMAAMAPYVCAFSDDGKGVQDKGLMREAMTIAKSLGKVIVAHCEDNSLLRGGYIHDGEYCLAHGHKGICSESEWRPIMRDIALAHETGCAYHVCHISTKESVKLIREAKKSGIDITCETAPHYLLLSDKDLREEGRFKMNPPLRSEADREALIEGILDGTIDMIATDHAPHSFEEKSKGLAGSLMGIVGIETAFPLIYTEFARNNSLQPESIVSLLHDNPLRRFGLNAPYEEGRPANFTVFDLESEYTINPSEFLSMGRSTPFEGRKVHGKCMLTFANGRIAYEADDLSGNR